MCFLCPKILNVRAIFKTSVTKTLLETFGAPDILRQVYECTRFLLNVRIYVKHEINLTWSKF